MTRSTRASNAIDRLKQRSGNPGWSMSITGSGHFFLTEGPGKPPLGGFYELETSSPAAARVETHVSLARMARQLRAVACHHYGLLLRDVSEARARLPLL